MFVCQNKSKKIVIYSNSYAYAMLICTFSHKNQAKLINPTKHAQREQKYKSILVLCNKSHHRMKLILNLTCLHFKALYHQPIFFLLQNQTFSLKLLPQFHKKQLLAPFRLFYQYFLYLFQNFTNLTLLSVKAIDRKQLIGYFGQILYTNEYALDEIQLNLFYFRSNRKHYKNTMMNQCSIRKYTLKQIFNEQRQQNQNPVNFQPHSYQLWALLLSSFLIISHLFLNILSFYYHAQILFPVIFHT